ncbi:hypothetical protein [Alkaliphilus peptidifermentans]|uniref:Uncharacterized protein n=1 Tax=Alkaliphilus peptidifermentans DSM 18978 TaxID=1120976 RepID=A0A1G5J9I5_9FIRM|nr:hypothetical protein [Alkaliphilus peptidifermentans]SCY84580.1 hypothetical protein SAMN03080606_02710 [Alkaliphilus peptidifermentans DSM 18978]
MAWWYGQQDSTKGAWDIDLHENKAYRNRKAAIKIITRGIIYLLLFLASFPLFPIMVAFAEKMESLLLLRLLKVLAFGVPVLGIASLQIPIGIYYLIKYFKVKNNIY